MKLKLYFIAILFFVLNSCYQEEEGYIQVQNTVHNSTLTNINWGEYGVYSSLIPGEKSAKITIYDEKNAWPKQARLNFHMVANNKSVYLETKQSYTLNSGETLLIVVSDSTVVTNSVLGD